MFKKFYLIVTLLALIMTSCMQGDKSGDAGSDNQKGVVKEVIQTSSYTYMRVEKNSEEQWIAVEKMNANVGDIVYYEEEMEMKNFKSPELGRTFESVYFIAEISKQPLNKEMPGGMHGDMGGDVHGTQPQKPVLSKLDIMIEQPEGGTTIANLYAKRETYGGKMVTVKGQVTKVNESIMGTNWVHLQDGTADGENFDLTITTQEVHDVGEVVTYSGILSLDKDFGAGYFYALIVEDAVVLEMK